MLTVDEKMVVTLSYVVQENDDQGAILETMDVNYPFKFMFGTGELLPAFEANLQGLAEGDSFAFKLTTDQAYGPYLNDNVVDVPLDVFKVGGILQQDLLIEGQFITLTDQGGVPHNGKILSWNEQSVKIDFNHAMAGKDLFFRGVVLNLRPANAEEVQRNHFVAQDGLRRSE